MEKETLKFSSWSELETIEFTFKRNKYNAECEQIITFDTETSNGVRRPNGNIVGFSHYLYSKKPEYYRDCEYVSIMYIWQIAIETQFGVKAFYGRTWADYKMFIRLLSNEMKYCLLYGEASHNSQNREERMEEICVTYKYHKWNITANIYVHNLGFDFQGLRNIYEDEFSGRTRKGKKSNVFARSPRKPMYAQATDEGIRWKYRDTYCLTHKSLKTWSNDEKLPVKKLSEPKDFYLPIRTPETPLTDEEMQYSLQDVVSMVYGIQKYREKYDELNNIPNTQTGEVRRTCVEKIAHANPTWAYNCAMVTKSYSRAFFTLLCKAFVGGWTHANARFNGDLLNNVFCHDFASSYPAVMCTRTYPLYEWEKCEPAEFHQLKAQDLHDINLKYHYLIVFSAKNVQSKLTNTFWSSSKAEEIEFELNDNNVRMGVDNGKISYCKYIKTVMTDLDFDTFEKAYDFEDLEIHELYKSQAGLLPTELVMTILDYYGKKTSLKDMGQDSLYNESKQFVNSIYGVSVTKVITDIIEFDHGWGGIKAEDIDDDMYFDIMQKTSETNSFLSYQIGVWVTAWARHNLWDGIIALDRHIAYGDTDSLKGPLTDEELEWFSEYNKSIEELENKIAAIHEFDPELFAPKTPKGKVKRLGVWDREDDCIEFKTLGAKRYVYTTKDKYGNIQLHATIAGLPKASATSKLKTVDEFDIGLKFDTRESGKTTAFYNDNQTPGVWIDRNGNKYYGDDKFGACLLPTTFDITISDEYDAFLNWLENGELEVDEDYVRTPDFLI